MNPLSIRGVFVSLTAVALFTGGASAQSKPEYNRDIRPILADNCFACHGPDSAARKASLRLDQRAAAIKVGAFDPGNADDSELVQRIFSTNPKEQMPPPTSRKKLTPEQKNLLKT